VTELGFDVLGANFAGFRGDPRQDVVDAPGQREIDVDMDGGRRARRRPCR
jgi:hypothetical protein